MVVMCALMVVHVDLMIECYCYCKCYVSVAMSLLLKEILIPHCWLLISFHAGGVILIHQMKNSNTDGSVLLAYNAIKASK